jgi:hypothetical protein
MIKQMNFDIKLICVDDGISRNRRGHAPLLLKVVP